MDPRHYDTIEAEVQALTSRISTLRAEILERELEADKSQKRLDEILDAQTSESELNRVCRLVTNTCRDMERESKNQ